MYRLRFILVMFQSFLTKKKGLLDEFKVNFWVVPLIDTDIGLLFTQTYNQYMALARWNLLFNSEFRTAVLKRGWIPVTAKETIKYKKSIKAFSRVSIVTRLLHWNEHRFYFEHIFYVKNEICAITYVEGLLKGPKGYLKPLEAFNTLGVTRESPALPENMKGWTTVEYEAHER